MIAEKKYKGYAETFRVSSFALALNMMYPQPKNEKTRFIILIGMLLTFIPAAVIFAFDIFESCVIGDFDNITRQATLVIPFFAVVVKMVVANIYRKDFAIILDEISEDLLAANDLSEDYQEILDRYIKSGLTAQRVWFIASIACAGIFPIMATGLMVNHNIKHNEVKRYMVHEVKLPGLEERNYDSPYFEIIFAYSFYLVYYFIVNFTGYDGTFCISVNHCSLKFKLMTHRIKMTIERAQNVQTIRNEMRKIVVEHNRVLEYANRLQTMYGAWLAVVFILTGLQICLTIYQLTETNQFDPKYIIFVAGSIAHIYIPCYYSAILQQTAIESATEIYCCGWERIMDRWLMNTVRFMIARAQMPINLTACGGHFTFDMLLFISMLQTSYSMYTLVTAR